MKVIVLPGRNTDVNHVNDVRQFCKDQGAEVHTWEQGCRYNKFDAVILVLNEDEDDIVNSAQYERENDVSQPDLVQVDVGRGLYEAYTDTVKTCFVVVGNSDVGFKLLPVMNGELIPGNDFKCWGEISICVHPWFVFNNLESLSNFRASTVLIKQIEFKGRVTSGFKYSVENDPYYLLLLLY